MNKTELGVIEDTLFVPMLGRIYASEHFPGILYDRKALELKEKLPEEVIRKDRQTQYTLLASASRSANIDRSVREFLEREPEGVIAQLGCGLETAFYRNDHGHTVWYGVDLPHVIAYRRSLLPEPERERYIAGDAFREDWIRQIRAEHPEVPVLVIASGLFYYFEESAVLGLIRMLQGFGDIELLFDAVSKSGMFMMRKKHMKTVGHADARMFFYVDSAEELVSGLSGVTVLAEEKYYRHISRAGLGLTARVSMMVSDWLGMVKMIHLKLGPR